jgi:hypothetical protein
MPDSKTFRDHRVSERWNCGWWPLAQVNMKEDIGEVDNKAA